MLVIEWRAARCRPGLIQDTLPSSTLQCPRRFPSGWLRARFHLTGFAWWRRWARQFARGEQLRRPGIGGARDRNSDHVGPCFERALQIVDTGFESLYGAKVANGLPVDDQTKDV